MEKLKLSDMTCAELVKEAAKMWGIDQGKFAQNWMGFKDMNFSHCSIYTVHDPVKDKAFELELSWIGQHTNGVHQRVPEDIHVAAEAFAKSALEEDSDSDLDESWMGA